ncbi:zinc ABC transporter substrate-binding protein [Mumia sp. ZJ1417]|uniref:metal ABC transporter substrate-binding protein n=1 Tax=Mumia sp. ZJ1417 TaxID=2708082 RepID=UPI001420E16B|nr:metal ABC transporter substrate-binding protein [Mumia sp. ZJ1417]QMW65146.1 zinc ABC transporter substrate-binding protein [Mumia sp. ZJ1417]
MPRPSSLRRTLRRPLAVLAVAPLALVLAACGSDGGGSGDAVRVTAAAYPFAYAAERIGGTMVDVDNLTSPGVEPHDAELTPRQLGEIRDSDLVVYLDDFQPQVNDAIDQAELDADALLDVADVVDLLDASDDGHTHIEGEEPGHAEEDHDHSATDPHVWLDPKRMAAIADAVADRLAEIDPDNAEAYRENADAFDAELTAIDTDFRTGLAQCETRTFVTSHAAFGYLADAYDLEQIAIAGIEPNTEPSTQQLAEIIELVKSEGITTVFTEELTSPRTADTIAREAGVATAILSPIEGLSDATEDETYLSLMRQNLAALQKANRCS